MLESDIERDDLIYSINEADNYAVEEALQIVARVGGRVTVVTVGSEDDEEVLRREMAMGAHSGVLISDEAFSGSDGRGIATVLESFARKGNYDLDFDRCPGGGWWRSGRWNAGGSARLSICLPWWHLIEVLDSGRLKISLEIAAGNKEMNEIDLPCVLSIQTGINEPRYVGMRGIRQVASGCRSQRMA